MSITAKDVQYNLIQNTAAVIVLNGKSYMIVAKDVRFKEVSSILMNGEWDKLPSVLDLGQAVTTYMQGNIEIKNGGVYFKGQALEGLVVDRVMAALETSKDYSDRLIKFIDKLYQNPSRNSVTQLYKFLEHKGLPLAEDGDVLGYKGVQSNYLSVRSGNEDVEVSTDGGKTFKVHRGHIPNNVGNIVRMSRNFVSDNPNDSCAIGLHVGSIGYAQGWGQHTVIVKFNPADAVSVPHCSSYQKLRTCGYTVISDCTGKMDEIATNTSNVYGGDRK